MPTFKEHINKSNDNIVFLERIKEFENYWDWKVTVSFYTALHLINAHISNKINEHYRSHNRVDLAINPYNQASPTKVDEDTYSAYKSLQNLSRRARYLVHEKDNNKSTDTHLTYDKHFKKAIKHLDTVISFFENEHKETIKRITLPKDLKVKSLSCIAFEE